MSENNMVYSIQRTYILTHVLTPEREIITCNQRIDIPTIEPLPNVQPVSTDEQAITVIPCVELAGAFLNEFNLTFETNEGVTVLPIKIGRGDIGEIENPYIDYRYVLVLPRGTTGVKSCKLIRKATGKEVQHNLTFGIMPPPYNYDNALFGYLIGNSIKNANVIADLVFGITYSNIKIKELRTIELPKGTPKEQVNISPGESLLYVKFNYPPSQEPTIHKPRIIVYTDKGDITYDLSLNETHNMVSINLLSGMITAYDYINGEIIQQFMLGRGNTIKKLILANFDDIDSPTLTVISKGCVLLG